MDVIARLRLQDDPDGAIVVDADSRLSEAGLRGNLSAQFVPRVITRAEGSYV